MSSILVLDANIIIRAVLGNKVRDYLSRYSESVDFFTPDTCMHEAKKYIPILFKKRNLSPELALEVFSHIKNILKVIDKDFYQEYEIEAKKRMRGRDLEDWPVVAAALLFDCPIWTEDKDFFGVGIPLWTTDRIDIFLRRLS